MINITHVLPTHNNIFNCRVVLIILKLEPIQWFKSRYSNLSAVSKLNIKYKIIKEEAGVVMFEMLI